MPNDSFTDPTRPKETNKLQERIATLEAEIAHLKATRENRSLDTILKSLIQETSSHLETLSPSSLNNALFSTFNHLSAYFDWSALVFIPHCDPQEPQVVASCRDGDKELFRPDELESYSDLIESLKSGEPFAWGRDTLAPQRVLDSCSLLKKNFNIHKIDTLPVSTNESGIYALCLNYEKDDKQSLFESISSIELLSTSIANALDQLLSKARLIELSQRFRNIVDSGPDAIAVFSLEKEDFGTITLVNNMAETLHGFDAGEMVGRKIWQDTLFDNDAVNESGIPLQSIENLKPLESGKELNLTIRRKRTDGSTFLASVAAISAVFENKKEAIAFCRDISEQDESTQLLEQTGRIAKIGGWEVDIATQTPIWSKEVYRIHEVDIGIQPKLEDAINFYAPEARDTINAAVKKCISEGVPWDLELPFITAKGNRIWVRAVGEAVQSEGKCIKLRGTFQNITRRKLAQLALDEKSSELEQILNTLPLSILYFDCNCKIQRINPAFAKCFGYESEELIGKKTRIMYAHESDYGTQKELCLASDGPSQDRELEFRKASGERFHGSIICSPLKSASGDTLGYLALVRDITREKSADKEIRELAERLTRVTRSSKIGIWDWDIKEDQLTWDDNTLKLYAVERNKFENSVSDWMQAIHPNDREQVSNAIREALNNKTDLQSTFRVALPNGDTRYLKTIGNLLCDQSGSPIRITGVDVDITEMQQANEAIRLRERAFSMLDVGIIITDPTNEDNPTIYCNQATQNITGYSEEEIIGRNCRFLSSNRSDPYERERLRDAIKTGEECRVVLENEKKDGTPFWNELLISPVRDEQGNLINFIGCQNDITDRVAAEKRLSDFAQRLQHSEHRLHSIIDNAVDSIITIDRKGRIESVNPATEKLFGYSSKELVGQNVSILMGSPHRGQHDGYLKNHLETGHTGIIGVGRELQAQHKDGSLIEIDLAVSKVELGDRIFFTGVLRDITNRKKAAREKEQLETQLRRSQRLETVGTLAGGIAHDFNNILTPIIGYAGMALLEIKKSEPFYDDIEIILKSARRAKELVEQILLFSRQAENQKQIISPRTLIKEILKLIKASIPDDIAIKEELDPNCRNIEADPTQFHQLILNLCTNAWQAMKGKQGLIEIKLKETQVTNPDSGEEEAFASIAIYDQGEGIEDKILSHIFEPFYTTKAVNEGTGLGLSVVHGIVTDHGGKIEVSSKPGKGSVFEVLLPISKESISSIETVSSTSHKGYGRILVVDDDQETSRTLVKMLEKLGYIVESYSNPINAISRAREVEEAYDLVLTDLSMPQMGGIELASQIHAIQEDTPVVVITGYREQIDYSAAKDAGIERIVNKPISIDELSQVIRETLSNTSS